MTEINAEEMQEFAEFQRFKKMRAATGDAYVETEEIPVPRQGRRSPGISDLVTKWYETNEKYKSAVHFTEELRQATVVLADQLMGQYGVDVVGMSNREIRTPTIESRKTARRLAPAVESEVEPVDDDWAEELNDYSPPVQRATAGEVPGEVLPDSAPSIPPELEGAIKLGGTRSVGTRSKGGGQSEQDFARGVAESLGQISKMLR